MSDLVERVVTRLDGPILLRTLHLLTNVGGNTAQLASLAALRHMDRVGLPCADLDTFLHFISSGSALIDSDEIIKFKESQWITSLQNNRSKRLNDLGANVVYHETDISKVIQIAQIYLYDGQYQDSQTVLASSSVGPFACQLAEQCAQVGLLQPNGLQLVLNQDKRIEAFLNTSLSNEAYLKRLTDKEVIAYWRTKFYIIYAEFLNQNYNEVSILIYKLLNLPAIQTTSGKSISALDVLNKSNFNHFIHKDEIILLSVLSILLSRPANELLDVLTEDEFILLVGSDLSRYSPFFIAVNNAKFKQLSELLNSLNEESQTSLFISRAWPIVRLNFRQIGYFLYLSSVRRVTGDHLSRKLEIPRPQLTREVIEFIKQKKLEFNYDESKDIFQEITTKKRDEIVESLQKLTEESDNAENIIRERIELFKSKLFSPKV